MNLFYLLTGGRPMTLIDYELDRVVNELVFSWVDKFGRKWLANNKWGWFRVKIEDKENEHESSL